MDIMCPVAQLESSIGEESGHYMDTKSKMHKKIIHITP